VARPFKRKVFYLPGFDPRGARHYHDLYATEAATYARLAGETLHVSERGRGGPRIARWTIANETGGVATEYDFLVWDDIIRRAWVNNPVTLLLRSTRTYWNYFTRIDWARVARLPRGPLITLFYPPLSTLLIPLVLGVAGYALARVWLGTALSVAIALAVALGIGFWLLHRMKSFWLLRFFIFNDELTRSAADPEIDARLDSFAELIDRGLEGDEDEVLLVTHSNGSILAVPLMDRLLARRGGAMPDKFTLVTLGQCIPLLGCRRDARTFHAELARVARGRFDWVDFGSAADGAAFCRVDPFAAIAEKPAVRLRQFSSAFFRFWSPAAYRQRRRNKYEQHFDYLRCGERLSPIDHVSMTAGRRTIDEAIAAFRAIA